MGKSKTFYAENQVETRILFRWLRNQRILELMYPFLPLLLLFVRKENDAIRLVSTSGIAHHIPGKWHRRILYIHSPASWIWDEKSFNNGRSKSQIYIARLLRPLFKIYDKKSIRSDDILIVNSKNTQLKVLQIYKRDSEIVFPPVVGKSEKSQSIDLPLEYDKFFLQVARVRGYKGTEILIDILCNTDLKLIIVGEGTERYSNNKNIIGLGYVTPSSLRWLYESAQALIAVSQEDFGLTPVEAALHGCPTIAFKQGGYLDSVQEFKSGQFVDPNDREELRNVLLNFNRERYSTEDMHEFAQEFSLRNHILKLSKHFYE